MLPVAQEFPDVLTFSFRDPVNAAVDWMRENIAWLTNGIKDAISYGLLNPIQEVLTTAPAWLVVGVAAGHGGHHQRAPGGDRERHRVRPRVRHAALAGLAWRPSSRSSSRRSSPWPSGILLGIASARNDRFRTFLRPLLDVAQTMPSFVYLLPAFVLFGPGRFTAIAAAVIFALPPVIRLVDVGIRAVPTSIMEAATSSGSTSRQILFKVQLPVARPALQLASNQAIILVLSMVVVGGIVGGQALGYNVVAGLAQNDLFGLGLASGLALVLLGIALDRMTRGQVHAADDPGRH